MEFLSALASYGIVLLAFVVVGGVAIFLGITMRKKKDASESTKETAINAAEGNKTEA